MTVSVAKNTSLTVMTQEQEMLDALERFKSIIREGELAIVFEIVYDTTSGITMPCYFAERVDEIGIGRGSSPMKAVNKLIRNLHISSVEQYIRLKEYHQQ